MFQLINATSEKDKPLYAQEKAGINSQNSIKFNSKRKKFILTPVYNTWHFMYDFLGQVLFISSIEDPENTEFIIFFDRGNHRSNYLMSFVKDFFDKLKIKHYFLLYSDQEIEYKDYYLVGGQQQPHKAMHNILYEAFLKAYPTKITTPHKKIYVNRLGCPIDRIDDEKKIEDFFIKKGFEIFSRGSFGDHDIIDDIKYFRDVKVIAGLSGAGLTNAIFMQPFSDMIELSVPQMTHIPTKEHLFPEEHDIARHMFHPLSGFVKNHMFIQIPINDHSAENTIRYIEEKNILL